MIDPKEWGAIAYSDASYENTLQPMFTEAVTVALDDMGFWNSWNPNSGAQQLAVQCHFSLKEFSMMEDYRRPPADRGAHQSVFEELEQFGLKYDHSNVHFLEIDVWGKKTGLVVWSPSFTAINANRRAPGFSKLQKMDVVDAVLQGVYRYEAKDVSWFSLFTGLVQGMVFRDKQDVWRLVPLRHPDEDLLGTELQLGKDSILQLLPS